MADDFGADLDELLAQDCQRPRQAYDDYCRARSGTTSASGLASPINSAVRFATASAAANSTASASFCRIHRAVISGTTLDGSPRPSGFAARIASRT